MAINKAKVLTVTSVKGGTGKTTTVLNIAGLLSLKKVKTLVIDLYVFSLDDNIGIKLSLDLDP